MTKPNYPNPQVHRDTGTHTTQGSLTEESQYNQKFLFKNLRSTKSRWLEILRPQGNPYGFDTKSEPQNPVIHQITRLKFHSLRN